MSDFKKQFFEWLREVHSSNRIEKVKRVSINGGYNGESSQRERKI